MHVAAALDERGGLLGVESLPTTAAEVDDASRLVTFSTDGSQIADRLHAGTPGGASLDGITAVVIAS